MDINNTQIEENNFQEALDAMPEEVRDYMWSPAFDYAIDVAEKVIGLTHEEKEYVRNVAYDLLMRLTDIETAAHKLLEQKVASEKVGRIMYYLDQEILQSAVNLINFYGDIQKVAVKNSEQHTLSMSQQTTQSDILSRLSQSLTTPTTLTPTKRTYTDTPSILINTLTPSVPKTLSETIPTLIPPTMDPYRELPDK